MAPSASELAILMRIKGSRQVQSEFRATAKEMKKVSPTVATLGKHFGATSRQIVRTDKFLKSMRRRVVGFGSAMLATAGAFAAWRGLESTIEITKDFNEQVVQFNRLTHIGVTQASRWIGVFDAFGIGSEAAGRSFQFLAKSIVSGSKATNQAFDWIGLNRRSLLTVDPTTQLVKVIDGLHDMQNVTVRNAAAARIFGRSWRSLLPLISAGSGELQHYLKLADQYGITIRGKAVKSAEDWERVNRESKLAMLGLQLTIGRKVLPQVIRLVKWIDGLILQWRQGVGTGGKLRRTFESIERAVRAAWPTIRRLAIELAKVVRWIVGAVKWMIKAGKATHDWSHALTNSIEKKLRSVLHPLRVFVGWVRKAWNWLKKIKDASHIKITFSYPGQGLVGKGKAAFNLARHPGRALHHGILGGVIGKANGGKVARSRPVKVGEFGPEIVQLPGNSSVTPASKSRDRDRPIHTHVYLDRKEIALAVSREVDDAKARRGNVRR